MALTEFALENVMPEVYILDNDFRKVDIIDDYTSLIWSRRYYETGDFEIYCNASEKNISLLQLGYYVMRIDDNEIFRIETVEISSNVEEGDFITASGRDLRSIIYQRCTLWKWTYGSEEPMRLELIVRQIINDNFINTASYDDSTELESDTLAIYNDERRKIDHVELGEDQGLEDLVALYEVSLQNIGDLIEDICDNYRWGWRLVYNGDHLSTDYALVFDVYKGEDKTDTVIFSEDFENLIDSSYKEDRSEYTNSYVVYDDDNDISMCFSQTEGIDRYEATPEEMDVEVGTGESMRWDNLVALYGWSWNGGMLNFDYDEEVRGWGWFGFTGYRYLENCLLWFEGFDFYLYGDTVWEAKVKKFFPDGYETTKNGIRCWHTDTQIGLTPESTKAPRLDGWNWDLDSFPRVSPEKPDSGHQSWLPSYKWELPSVIQQAIMQDNAYANIDLFIRDTEFSGTIEPNTTYRYKEDYDLGTLVTVRTKYGITKSVRISEVVETFDEDGYNIEVNFESEG